MKQHLHLTDYAKGFIEGNGSHLAGRFQYLHDLNQPYVYQDAIDPSASMQVDGDYVHCPPYTVLADVERPRIHHTYVLDIESWGFRANVLHLGVLMSMRDESDCHVFRSWHHTYKENTTASANGKDKTEISIKHYGGIELLEDILFKHACESKDPVRIHTFAHFGSGHDWAGLAHSFYSNRDFAPEVQALDPATKKEITKKLPYAKRYALHPEVRPYMMRAISGGREKFRRRRYWISPKTGKKEAYDLSWELKTMGKYSALIIHLGESTMWLLDSHWHLSEPLSVFGAKGNTPLQYVHPEKWLDQKIESGDLVLSEGSERKKMKEKVEFWHDYLDEEAVEYCVQDCKILSQALKDYTRTVAEAFKNPQNNKPLFALAYPTGAQVAKVGQILSQVPPKKQGNGILMLGKGGRWRVEKHLDAIVDFQMDNHGHVSKLKIPFARRNELALSNGWYCERDHVLRWREIQIGGRTEVFKPMNSPGTKVIMLDAKSHYPSQMVLRRVLDPRNIQEVPQDIVGRDAILDHLEEHSGMYLIRTKPSMDPTIRDRIPVFPFRISGEDFDSRLVFGKWEGYFQRHVSGEELKYFLEIAEVEDDDIRIVAGKSYFAPLLDIDEAPFYNFIKVLYKKRQEALEEGDQVKAKMLKRLMNSGGYGIHVQQNTEKYKIRENDTGNRTQDAIVRMIGMSPEWDGWNRLEDMTPEQMKGKEIVGLAQDWAMAHYRGVKRVDIDRGNEEGHAPQMQIEIELPDKQAPHAIRPWGCAIAAHGRVSLHKALLAVKRADSRFDLLYCDTDSVYFEVPEWMSVEEVIEKLHAVKISGKRIINIGNELGDWEIQHPEANPKLVTDDADIDENGLIQNPQGVFLAPKHYYLLDKKYNVLKDTVKSIPKSATDMRCAMIAVFAHNSKLGDPRGVYVNIQLERNLIDKIYQGVGVKRSYPSMTAPSHPAELKNLTQEEAEGLTCMEYTRALSGKVRTRPAGIQAAVDHYVDNCKIRGRSFFEVKKSIEDAVEESLNEMAMTPEAVQHENMLAEIMFRKGIYNPETAEDDGLPI